MKTILFQGDSITDWYRDRDRDDILGANYALMAAGELGCKEPNKYNFVNRGIGGDRTVDILARVHKEMLQIKPDYVSILVGINDVWHGFDLQNGITDKNFELYYNLIIEEIRDVVPSAEIMMLEPFILDASVTKGRWEEFSAEVFKKAEIVRKAAKDNNTLFVPLQETFNRAAELAPAEFWTIDGVHPTAAGHCLIKNEWIKAFEQLQCPK